MIPIDAIVNLWAISLRFFVLSAIIQIIGLYQNMDPKSNEALSKLAHIINTSGMIILAFGLINLIV